MWSPLQSVGYRPSAEEIFAYMRCPLWHELCDSVEATWDTEPRVEFGQCPGYIGWSIKYKLGATTLCVLYPDKQEFYCRIAFDVRETPLAEVALLDCDLVLQRAYWGSKPFNDIRTVLLSVDLPVRVEGLLRLMKAKSEARQCKLGKRAAKERVEV